MNRAEFNRAMRDELRNVLSKHEKERAEVKTRDDLHREGLVLAAHGRDGAIQHAADQLDLAICLATDRLYDLIKGEDAA